MKPTYISPHLAQVLHKDTARDKLAEDIKAYLSTGGSISKPDTGELRDISDGVLFRIGKFPLGK